MKYRLIVCILALCAAISPVWSQDADESIFVRNLIEALERHGWDTSDIGELERELLQHRWEHHEGVDPEAVAFALSYGRDRGIDEPVEQAEIAGDIIRAIDEMSSAGLSSRESVRAVLNGLRAASRSTEDTNSVFQAQMQERKREAVGNSMRRELKHKTEDPHKSNTWASPSARGSPNGGLLGQPPGPGPGPSSGTGPGPDSDQDSGSGSGSSQGSGSDAGADSGSGSGSGSGQGGTDQSGKKGSG